MKAILNKLNDAENSIYKVSCIVKCMHTVLKHSLINNEDCSSILPLTEITEFECEKLQEKFEHVSSIILQDILLKK